MERISARGGDEYDTFSKSARKYLCYLARSGVTKGIKRQYNKRFRKHNKEIIKENI